MSAAVWARRPAAPWGLGRFGLWSSALDRQPAARVRAAVPLIEALGYSVLWVGEARRREIFVNAALLLSVSDHLVIGSGIANIWARDPAAMSAGQSSLLEAFAGRFILGLGVSHDVLVAERGHRYGRPLQAMRDYLEQMDQFVYDAPPPARGSKRRVLAALGPKMLALAAERADGAHPYLVPPEHTVRARRILGPDKWLAPELAVVLGADRADSRRVARRHLTRYLELANYRANLARFGFGDDDFAHGGSDRLVDALVGCGEREAVQRAQDHLDAGADHVAFQVLSSNANHLPLNEWRRLAEALS